MIKKKQNTFWQVFYLIMIIIFGMLMVVTLFRATDVDYKFLCIISAIMFSLYSIKLELS